jgi:hypothetical protein
VNISAFLASRSLKLLAVFVVDMDEKELLTPLAK